MSRQETAATIINDTAIEVGLVPVNDPYSTQDEAFVQLRGLLNSAGRELVTMFAWEMLQRPFEITTQIGDSGTYALPTDFDHFTDQTGWNISARLPVYGPLSPQDWAAMTSLPIVPVTYLGFRLSNNKIDIFPSPPPPDAQLKWWYISRNWVQAGANTADRATSAGDVVMYDPTLMVKFLKVKYLSAKGFDIGTASREFDMTFMSMTGQDKGARVLSAAGSGGFPYLGHRNLPWTGYGT